MLVTRDDFAYAAGRLAGQPRVAVDTETTGLRLWPRDNPDRMIGISASVPAKEGGGLESFYFPFRHLPGGNLPKERLADLAEVLHAPGQSVVGANSPYDAKVLAFEGFRTPDTVEDALTLGHLMNENEEHHRLKWLGDKYLGPGSSMDETVLMTELAALGYKGKDAKRHMNKLAPWRVAAYACSDTELAWGLVDFYRPHAERWRLWDLWREVNKYSLAINAAESRGMLVDVDTLHRLSGESAEKAERSMQVLVELNGGPINLQSNPQLQRLFGVPSTAKKVLDVLIDRWEESGDPRGAAGRALQAYRSFSKADNTYYEPYLEWMDPDCAVHANLNIIGTYSGRCSCSNPNLQAVPRYDKMPVKDVFVARPGYFLLELDYSQAEMRIACFYARERAMAEILRAGGDMHAATAQRILELTGIRVIRDDAKRINFGILYGLGVKGLSDNLVIPRQQARTMLEGYHNAFPGFRQLYRRMQQEAEQRGYIRLYTGRVRHFNTPEAEPHKAMSNRIQGTVAELVREKITAQHLQFAREDVHLLLQVHDSFIFEVPEGREDLVPDIVRVLEETPFDPPMVVDAKVGYRWGQLRKVTREQLTSGAFRADAVAA